MACRDFNQLFLATIYSSVHPILLILQRELVIPSTAILATILFIHFVFPLDRRSARTGLMLDHCIPSPSTELQADMEESPIIPTCELLPKDLEHTT